MVTINNELGRLLRFILNEYLPIQEDFIKEYKYSQINNDAILLSAKLLTLNQRVYNIKCNKRYHGKKQIVYFINLTKELGTFVSLIGSGVKHELIGDNTDKKLLIFESILSKSTNIESNIEYVSETDTDSEINKSLYITAIQDEESCEV